MKKIILIAITLVSIGVVLIICAVIGLFRCNMADIQRENKLEMERTLLLEKKKLDGLKKRFFDSTPPAFILPQAFKDDPDKGMKVRIIKEHLQIIMNEIVRSVITEMNMNDLISFNLDNKVLSNDEKLDFYKRFYEKARLFPEAIGRIKDRYAGYKGEEMKIYDDSEITKAAIEVLKEESDLISKDHVEMIKTFRGHDDMIAKREEIPEILLSYYRSVYDSLWGEQGIILRTLSRIASWPTDSGKKLLACFK